MLAAMLCSDHQPPMTAVRLARDGAHAVARILVPVMAAVLAGFLVIGAALPVLPLYVSHNLGFSTLVVGFVAGAQFVASLATRIWSGSYSDAKGGKRSVVRGL